jgi:hypothetical protein
MRKYLTGIQRVALGAGPARGMESAFHGMWYLLRESTDLEDSSEVSESVPLVVQDRSIF